MRDFLALRNGSMQAIGLTNAQGLIQLPSYHNVLALMLTYNLRHNRWVLLGAVLFNTTLILSLSYRGQPLFHRARSRCGRCCSGNLGSSRDAAGVSVRTTPVFPASCSSELVGAGEPYGH
jgi:hypothetical protein